MTTGFANYSQIKLRIVFFLMSCKTVYLLFCFTSIYCFISVEASLKYHEQVAWYTLPYELLYQIIIAHK